MSDLKKYDSNPRTHSAEQILQISKSIKEFGFTNPLLIDSENNIIAGHGRLEAAMKIRLDTLPCIIIDGLSKDQKNALLIADNQLSLNSGWDLDLLKMEIQNLTLNDYDIDILGFDEDFIADLLNDPVEGLTDEDDVPEVQNVVTVLGDIWELGNHKIICGDSTSADTVKALLGDIKPHLMVTDPPYGVEYDANWRMNRTLITGKKLNKRATLKVENDDNADWSEAWALFNGDVAYVWHAALFTTTVYDSLISNNFDIKAQIIWSKNNIVIGRSHYHWKHEPLCYAIRKGATGHWKSDRKQSTIWNIDKPLKSETGHSTQKPVECMRKPIENNSSPGQAIYEPFSGSGTTIIAAEQTGRHCYAIELNPQYVDIAVKRWMMFTGNEAIHSTSKKTYNELLTEIEKSNE